MERVRCMYFVLLRLVGYAVVYASVALYGGPHPWWQWVAGGAVTAWGIWDRWKRPDDSPHDLRLGVWTELIAIIAWSLLSQNSTPLFLLVSPLMRTCVHLSTLESAGLGLVEGGTLLAFHLFLPNPLDWVVWGQVASLVAMGPYAYVMGALVRERETARRQLAVVALEQEERLKNDERIRIARQLHDVMGQYWTAVIRGLDVALVTSGEQQRTFLLRTQEAAERGLQEMRTAVHDWNDGHQTPAAWLGDLAASVDRFQSTVGIAVSLQQGEIDWSRFPDAAGAAEALTRTAVEGLTNAVRHGQASRVTIRLVSDETSVTLRVEDNGIGLATNHLAGLGIQSMRELALTFGGTLEVESKHGTSITMRLPYAEQGAIA